jgi:hypothetical protein
LLETDFEDPIWHGCPSGCTHGYLIGSRVIDAWNVAQLEDVKGTLQLLNMNRICNKMWFNTVALAMDLLDHQ